MGLIHNVHDPNYSTDPRSSQGSNFGPSSCAFAIAGAFAPCTKQCIKQWCT
ncbi:hypothetical protein PROPHIGD68-1_12 [Mycobacterium phage prophi68-1]|nr:hypothetical protein PROPHIGD68-1_12 [Mycobacterium phage prophi68-1]QSM05035.1 hypothetical protein PROPHIGD04-1_12 [Mycobacterium phage prophiGD04-1]